MSNFLEAVGFKAPMRRIYNMSNVETIFLIPFRASLSDGDEKPLVEDLVEGIPAGGSIEVDCSKYDLGKTDALFQMYILFRAGKDISSILGEGDPKCVELAADEKAYMHSQLSAEPTWYFRHDKRQGIVVRASQNEFELRSLRDEVEELKKAVETLRETIANLEKRLPQSTPP